MTSSCSLVAAVAFLGSQVEAACQTQAATGGYADRDSALSTRGSQGNQGLLFQDP